jgi:hypothetical protein
MFMGYQRILFRLNCFSNLYTCDSRDGKFSYYAILINQKEFERIGKSEKDIWFRNFHNAFFKIDTVEKHPYEGYMISLGVEKDHSYCSHMITLRSL